MIYGVDLSTTSDATLGSPRELDTVIHVVETCNLDAMKHVIDPLGPKLSLSFPEVQKRIFFKKRPNCKNLGSIHGQIKKVVAPSMCGRREYLLCRISLLISSCDFFLT